MSGSSDDNDELAPPKQKISRTERAGLIFPVPRTEHRLRKLVKERVSGGAPIYLAAVLEYLTAEVLEVAGHHAIRAERGRITPRDIQLSMMADAELWPLVKNAIIPRAGRPVSINAALLPSASRLRLSKERRKKLEEADLRKFKARTRNRSERDEESDDYPDTDEIDEERYFPEHYRMTSPKPWPLHKKINSRIRNETLTDQDENTTATDNDNDSESDVRRRRRKKTRDSPQSPDPTDDSDSFDHPSDPSSSPTAQHNPEPYATKTIPRSLLNTRDFSELPTGDKSPSLSSDTSTSSRPDNDSSRHASSARNTVPGETWRRGSSLANGAVKKGAHHSDNNRNSEEPASESDRNLHEDDYHFKKRQEARRRPEPNILEFRVVQKKGTNRKSGAEGSDSDSGPRSPVRRKTQTMKSSMSEPINVRDGAEDDGMPEISSVSRKAALQAKKTMSRSQADVDSDEEPDHSKKIRSPIPSPSQNSEVGEQDNNPGFEQQNDDIGTEASKGDFWNNDVEVGHFAVVDGPSSSGTEPTKSSCDNGVPLDSLPLIRQKLQPDGSEIVKGTSVSKSSAASSQLDDTTVVVEDRSPSGASQSTMLSSSAGTSTTEPGIIHRSYRSNTSTVDNISTHEVPIAGQGLAPTDARVTQSGQSSFVDETQSRVTREEHRLSLQSSTHKRARSASCLSPPSSQPPREREHNSDPRIPSSRDFRLEKSVELDKADDPGSRRETASGRSKPASLSNIPAPSNSRSETPLSTHNSQRTVRSPSIPASVLNNDSQIERSLYAGDDMIMTVAPRSHGSTKKSPSKLHKFVESPFDLSNGSESLSQSAREDQAASTINATMDLEDEDDRGSEADDESQVSQSSRSRNPGQSSSRDGQRSKDKTLLSTSSPSKLPFRPLHPLKRSLRSPSVHSSIGLSNDSQIERSLYIGDDLGSTTQSQCTNVEFKHASKGHISSGPDLDLSTDSNNPQHSVQNKLPGKQSVIDLESQDFIDIDLDIVSDNEGDNVSQAPKKVEQLSPKSKRRPTPARTLPAIIEISSGDESDTGAISNVIFVKEETFEPSETRSPLTEEPARGKSRPSSVGLQRLHKEKLGSEKEDRRARSHSR